MLNLSHQLRKKCVLFPTCILHLTVLLNEDWTCMGCKKCTKSVLFVLRRPFLGRVLAKVYNYVKTGLSFDLLTGHIWSGPDSMHGPWEKSKRFTHRHTEPCREDQPVLNRLINVRVCNPCIEFSFIFRPKFQYHLHSSQII